MMKTRGDDMFSNALTDLISEVQAGGDYDILVIEIAADYEIDAAALARAFIVKMPNVKAIQAANLLLKSKGFANT